MESVTDLLTAVLGLPLVLAALVYIVHPRKGADLLKSAVVLLVAGSLGMCVLASLLRCLEAHPWVVVCILILTVTTAFVIRESLHDGHRRLVERPTSLERTPVLPRDGAAIRR